MPKIRVYVDTSVFGGVYDAEFAEASRAFFDHVKSGRITVMVSRHTMRELERAPHQVVQVFHGLPQEYVEFISISSEMEVLAEAYVEAQVLGGASHDDALHVAIATVSNADMIVSWNFKHLVRYDRIRSFNGVNGIRGYRSIDIRSPMEARYE